MKSVPRANPYTGSVLDQFARAPTQDVLMDAGVAAAAAVGTLIVGSLLLRDSGFGANGKMALIGASMVGGGIAVRKTFPRAGVGLLVSGATSLMIPLVEGVTGSVKGAFSPSGAPALPALNPAPAVKVINNGMSAVMPIQPV